MFYMSLFRLLTAPECFVHAAALAVAVLSVVVAGWDQEPANGATGAVALLCAVRGEGRFSPHFIRVLVVTIERFMEGFVSGARKQQ